MDECIVGVFFLRRALIEGQQEERLRVEAGGLRCRTTSGAMAVSKVRKQVIKSPSMALSYLVSVASLLTGAAVVHNIFKPDLTIPDVRSQDIVDKEPEGISNAGDVE